MKKVLIVEDDPGITALISLHLRDLGFQVEHTGDGQTGLALGLQQPFDLIVLDLMLPRLDGLELCKRLRAKEVNTPILMLTARSEEIDKVLGLESGADDYLTKPFGIREFLARVKAILRRTDLLKEEKSSDLPNLMDFANLKIDIEKRKVEAHGERVELTPKEFDLLVLLASHPGKSYSRSELLKEVWGYEFSGYEHTVNSHINRLRMKIESNPAEPVFVLTTWGVGYRFNDEMKR